MNAVATAAVTRYTTRNMPAQRGRAATSAYVVRGANMTPVIRAGRLFGLVAERTSTVGSVCTISVFHRI
jgi:hypothetical protein